MHGRTQILRNFISTSNHVLFYLLYKRHWPLLTRKFDKRPWIENGERIAIQSSSTRQGGAHQQLLGDIRHTQKTYRNFTHVRFRLFSGLEILVKHSSLYYELIR